MGAPYVGEIRMFAGTFAPAGWATCDGQTIAIAENPTLFQLIGTTFGGDGQETFDLPNLAGRLPIHQGTGSGLSTYIIGEQAGVQTVTLSTQQMPAHSHPMLASLTGANSTNPQGNVLASPPTIDIYRQANPSVSMDAHSITPAGGGQPHENMMPFLAITFIISLFGIFPTPT